MQYSEQLHYFIEIVRAGSFSRAAKKLGLATSTLTKSLTHLETNLDKILLKRLKSGVELTDIGQDLYGSVIESYRTIEHAVSKIKETKTKTKKSIKIITTTGMTSIWLMPRLKIFQDQNPDVNVTITTTNKKIALSETDADIAILPSISDPGLHIKKKLYSFKIKLLASPDYLEKHGTPKTMDDLKDHRLIGYYSRKETFNGNVDWHLHGSDKDLEPNLVINSATCIFYATLLGQGISALGDDFSIDARLVEVLPDVNAPTVDVFFFFPKKIGSENEINALYCDLSKPLDDKAVLQIKP